jgi:hypothetical protein
MKHPELILFKIGFLAVRMIKIRPQGDQAIYFDLKVSDTFTLC